MTGWQQLWQNPEVVKLWRQLPPLPQVIEMADLLEAEGRRRVLDIGCGLGRHTVYLAARGFEVAGTENAAAAIAVLRENLARAGLTIDLREVDMRELPFPDSHFDGIVASHVIHHTDGPGLKQIIETITRKLAPGGLLVWATPSTRHWRCGLGEEVDPGTWVDEDHWEGPIAHHYCTEPEVRELLRDYDVMSLVEHQSREGSKSHFHWRLLARKRAEQ